MKHLLFSLAGWFGLSLLHASAASQYFAGDGSLLSGSKWAANSSGPFSSALTAGNVVVFATPNGTGAGASIKVGGIIATENFTLNSTNGTISNQVAGGIVTIDVAAGKTLDFSNQQFSSSGTAGYVKNGQGALAWAGGQFGGGFTLNEGTLVLRSVNGLGTYNNNIYNTATINGGVLASTGTFDLTAKLGGPLTIGGDFQAGDVTGLAHQFGIIILSSTVDLGAANRTITIGNKGALTLSGNIVNSAPHGLTIAANANGALGRVEITGSTNTFSGPITLLGGETKFSADGSLGAVNNPVIIDGGKLTNIYSFTVSPTRTVYLGSAAGTAICTAGTLTMAAGMVDQPGEKGVLNKQGIGTLYLTSTASYSGATNITTGTVKLGGANVLPTGTTITLGQSGTNTLGALNLNGYDQQIAGLNSLEGTNVFSTKNNVSSAVPATLTIGGTGSYSFGAGSKANSGIITGAVSIVKTGPGSQTFGDANSYTGSTIIREGRLALSGSGCIGTGDLTLVSGTLDVSGVSAGIYAFTSGQTVRAAGVLESGSKTISISGTFEPGNGPHSLTLNGTLVLESPATTNFQLGAASLAGYSRITGLRDFTLGGTMQIQLVDGYLPSANSRFDLFDWSGTLNPSGFDPALNLSLPALSDGLRWDTSSFLVDGSVLVVPELSPSAGILVGLGMIWWGAGRARKLCD